MPNYQAVSHSAHAHRGWRRYSSYAFASRDAAATLTVQEAGRAALYLPLAFIPAAEGVALVAMQGLAMGQNLLVDAQGRWQAVYVPAVYRSHPFRFGTVEGSDQPVLCVDADSGLLTDSTGDGEAFFAADGQPAPALQQVMQLLQAVASDQPRTERICAQLQALELLEPWPIVLKTDQGEQAVQGLLRINEARLQALEASVLKELQDSGALVLAYCQLLSMQHLPLLATLARKQPAASANVPAAAQGLPTNPRGEIDLEFLHKAGTLNFGNL